MADKRIENSRRNPYRPQQCSLTVGEKGELKDAGITLVSLSAGKASVQIVYRGKHWQFDLVPSDTRIFDDLALQCLAFETVEEKATFRVFPKNEILK